MGLGKRHGVCGVSRSRSVFGAKSGVSGTEIAAGFAACSSQGKISARQLWMYFRADSLCPAPFSFVMTAMMIPGVISFLLASPTRFRLVQLVGIGPVRRNSGRIIPADPRGSLRGPSSLTDLEEKYIFFKKEFDRKGVL